MRAFSIDTSRRTKHGALLDAELLAEVYVELTGKRQARLSLLDAPARLDAGRRRRRSCVCVRRRWPPRMSDAERDAHRAFVATLGEKAIWNEYLAA